MNIEFCSLTVRNFGSFNEAQTFDFSSREYGAYFIRGDNQVKPKLVSNGSGKSTFFVHALCWVLTGRMPRGLRSTDIKPWQPQGKDTKTSATLVFAIDGKSYVLVRVAPNAITLNGEEVAQDQIDRLTRLSYPVLKQTLVFGQHEPLFFDLTNNEKLAVLSEVLELDKWELRSQKASERAKEMDRKVAELQAQINSTNSSIENSRKLLEETRALNETWKYNKADRIDQLKKDIKQVRYDHELKEKVLKSRTRIAKDSGGKLGELQADVHTTADKIKELETKEAARHAQQRYLKKDIEKLTNELDDLGNADTCPTCGQSIDGTDLHKHKKELRTKRKQLQAELAKLEEGSLRPAIDILLADYSRRRASVSTQQAQVDTEQRELAAITREVTSLEYELKNLRSNLERVKDEKNPYIAQIKSMKDNIAALEAKVGESGAALKKTHQRLERAKYWVKGFKDVRLFIIEDVLQELEITTNTVLGELGLNDWQVNYSIERETKSGTLQTGMIISILTPNNDKPVRWESWSGGEGQRLRLAGSLALSEVLLNYAGVSIDLEVFDEPTKHLNSGGVDDFCELLATRADDLKRRIFLVDHSAIESAAFVDSVTVVKTAKGSYIET